VTRTVRGSSNSGYGPARLNGPEWARMSELSGGPPQRRDAMMIIRVRVNVPDSGSESLRIAPSQLAKLGSLSLRVSTVRHGQ
jgi:hypothetical protein